MKYLNFLNQSAADAASKAEAKKRGCGKDKADVTTEWDAVQEAIDGTFFSEVEDSRTGATSIKPTKKPEPPSP